MAISSDAAIAARAVTIVRGGMASTAILINVKELPQISDNRTRSPISNAGVATLRSPSGREVIVEGRALIGDRPLKSELQSRMTSRGGNRSRESDSIVRSSPFPATRRDRMRLVCPHGHAFNAADEPTTAS